MDGHDHRPPTARRRTPTVPVGDEPHGVLPNAEGDLIYVLNTGQDSVSIVDAATLKETKRVMAGGIEQKHFRPIKAGDVLVMQRTLVDIFEKQGKTGPLIFIVYTVDAKTEDGEMVMQQTQTRIVR